jgi:GDPmannose 4,6-dehydratase
MEKNKMENEVAASITADPTVTPDASRGSPRRALICGITGQDGAYLSELLLEHGYSVVGTSRDAFSARVEGLTSLGIKDRIHLASMVPNDFRSVLQTLIRFEPTEIYNLAGQTSVGLSFEQPVEAIESIALGTLNLLEAIRIVNKNIRFYSAGSSECFGDTGTLAANESTPFLPRSPYAVAKTTAHHLVANYREAYGLFACTGILFNHESPLRPERFVTQKIIHAAARIAAGDKAPLRLGNLTIHRDWGWAPEYVEVMWRLIGQERPSDYVIATGRSVSLEYFVEQAFNHFGLDWRQHVVQDPALIRPTDIEHGAADPSRAHRELGWRATHDVDSVIAEMIKAAVAGKVA